MVDTRNFADNTLQFRSQCDLVSISDPHVELIFVNFGKDKIHVINKDVTFLLTY